MDDIARWLEELGLAQFAAVFAENGIDRTLLPQITNEDLKDLGVARLADRKRLLAAAAGLREDGSEVAIPGTTEGGGTSAEAERRQVCVMFVDLVGSTELSRRFDPEDLRELMRQYQDVVAGVVTRYGGHIAKYLGDGVLAYFGWPQAHEDQAERAVRGGLELVEAVSRVKLEDGATLQTRVGIATGVVVIGDLLGEAGAVSGETPNLAARLQEAAQPGQLVIDEATRHLIAESFDLEDCEARKLKGFQEPVLVWRVLGEREVESRFEAAHGGALTTFVGREHEVGLLLDRWSRAKRSEGQIVMLSGEAGIGKSRIAQTLHAQIRTDPHFRLSYQCLPYYVGTALHPFVRQLEHAAGFRSEDDADTKLTKIEAMVVGELETVAEAVPVIAALLSVPMTGQHFAPPMTAQQLKQTTLRVLCDQLVALATRRPVLIVFEDIHWADPTTLEALEMMIDRVQDVPVLAVITHRPDFTPRWHGYSHLTALSLNRLGNEQCTSIVVNAAGSKSLPSEVIDQILAKTDGVPLFVEELTKTVIESDLLDDEGDRYVLRGRLPALALPNTLQDSLVARLDRQSAAKEVAQIGAVIGREFSFALLAAISSQGDAELADALRELVNAELIFQRGTPPNARFIFKHALLQDAAYGSLLKARRQVLHRQIAEALESPAFVTTGPEPELVAHHLTNAGLKAEALPHWHKAGQQALARFANKEAVMHLTKALDFLKELPQGSDRDTLELDILLELGPAQQSTGGFATAEVHDTYGRAHELCGRVGEEHQRFAATWGLWLNYQQASGFEFAERLSRELMQVAEQKNDSNFSLQAHHAAWTSLLPRGDVVRCYEHAIQGVDLYDPAEHEDHARTYGGHDPGVCGRAHASMSSWLIGDPDLGVPLIDEGIELAQRLQQPLSQMIILTFGGFYFQFRGEARRVKELAEMAISIGKEYKISQHLGVARVLHGWSRLADDSVVNGVEEMERGLSEYRATGAKLRCSYYLSLLAEGYLAAGEFDRGLDALAEAQSVSDEIGERWWRAEVLRLRSEIMLASGIAENEIEANLRSSLRIAREQNARSLELRAATSLAQLWSSTGRGDEASQLLAPIYGNFGQGFETADLKRAKSLLDALARN